MIEISRLLESNFYIHYEMHPLPDHVRKSCESMVHKIYRMLDIDYWESCSNDIFEIHPSSDVECDCGWDNLPEWDELCNLQHRSECFQTRLREFRRIYGIGGFSEEERSIYNNAMERWFRDLFRANGWDNQDPWWYGIETRCDCDYPQREKEIILKMVQRFGPGHSKDCIMFQPQLIYKPEDFRVWWYKYPLREAATSRKTDVEHFSNIIRECINSIRR